MESEVHAYSQWVALTLRAWAAELSAVVEGNTLFGGAGPGAEEARKHPVDLLVTYADGFESNAPQGGAGLEETALALREVVMAGMFPWNEVSPARAVLGSELATYLRERLVRLTTVAAPAAMWSPGDPDESHPGGRLSPSPLWTEGLLEETRQRVEPTVEAALDLALTAPHLGPSERQTLADRVRSVGSGVSSGSTRQLLSADLELSEIFSDIEENARLGYEAASGPVFAELATWEPQLAGLEDRVRRIHESPLYGGRGAGTIGLVFLGLSLVAGFLMRDRLATVAFILAAAVAGAAVWLIFNGLAGSLTRPYMEALNHVKGLTRDLKDLQDPLHLCVSRISKLRGRLRSGPPPSTPSGAPPRSGASGPG